MSNTKELAKSFEPAGIEERWYPVWEQRGYFDALKEQMDGYGFSVVDGTLCVTYESEE